MSFIEVLDATTILACFENFLKSRFIIIAKSAITLYISCQKSKEKRIFFNTCSKRFVFLSGILLYNRVSLSVAIIQV